MAGMYDLHVTDRVGKDVALSDYRGKVLLIVNTATGCGFTPQYEALENLYEECKEKGFEILDFPCNQFGGQAPGSADEIHQFCTLKYNASFPQFKKVEVNGEGADPLFSYLKERQGFKGFDGSDKKMVAFMNEFIAKQHPDYQATSDIKWNFTKFLVDRQGNVVARFEPTHDMSDVRLQVLSLLG